jgi:hypothetical protein
MLVSIKDTKNEQNKFNKDKKKSFKIAKRTISKNNINSITSHIINNNINSENSQTGITTTNNDIIATSTSMNDYKIKDSVRNLIQKGTENKK